MQMAGINLDNVVNCRIGSLEKVLSNVFCIVQVNCRIGSLERQRKGLRQRKGR